MRRRDGRTEQNQISRALGGDRHVAFMSEAIEPPMPRSPIRSARKPYHHADTVGQHDHYLSRALNRGNRGFHPARHCHQTQLHPSIGGKPRPHFFAMPARLMRRVLVDHARSRAYSKRGAGARHISFDEALVVADKGADLVALDDALAALAVVDERQSQVVNCASSAA